MATPGLNMNLVHLGSHASDHVLRTDHHGNGCGLARCRGSGSVYVTYCEKLKCAKKYTAAEWMRALLYWICEVVED